jgi:hypothetical protein
LSVVIEGGNDGGKQWNDGDKQWNDGGKQC